jgi:MraZ protein
VGELEAKGPDGPGRSAQGKEKGKSHPLPSMQKYLRARGEPGENQAADLHFYGSTDHSLDDKNRITVPVQFRAGLGERFYLCKGMNDKCLWLLPEHEFKVLLDNMKERIPRSDRRGQKWVAMFTESAADRRLDNQNRIAIPGNLLEYAGINDKVKIFGHDERIEIWAMERWSEEMSEDFSDLSVEMFEKYNI